MNNENSLLVSWSIFTVIFTLWLTFFDFSKHRRVNGLSSLDSFLYLLCFLKLLGLHDACWSRLFDRDGSRQEGFEGGRPVLRSTARELDRPPSLCFLQVGVPIVLDGRSWLQNSVNLFVCLAEVHCGAVWCKCFAFFLDGLQAIRFFFFELFLFLELFKAFRAGLIYVCNGGLAGINGVIFFLFKIVASIDKFIFSSVHHLLRFRFDWFVLHKHLFDPLSMIFKFLLSFVIHPLFEVKSGLLRGSDQHLLELVWIRGRMCGVSCQNAADLRCSALVRCAILLLQLGFLVERVQSWVASSLHLICSVLHAKERLVIFPMFDVGRPHVSLGGLFVSWTVLAYLIDNWELKKIAVVDNIEFFRQIMNLGSFLGAVECIILPTATSIVDNDRALKLLSVFFL